MRNKAHFGAGWFAESSTVGRNCQRACCEGAVPQCNLGMICWSFPLPCPSCKNGRIQGKALLPWALILGKWVKVGRGVFHKQKRNLVTRLSMKDRNCVPLVIFSVWSERGKLAEEWGAAVLRQGTALRWSSTWILPLCGGQVYVWVWGAECWESTHSHTRAKPDNLVSL